MTSPLTNFIAELRRRRVFRVAAVYAGIAFVIIQIIDGAFVLMGVMICYVSEYLYPTRSQIGRRATPERERLLKQEKIFVVFAFSSCNFA